MSIVLLVLIIAAVAGGVVWNKRTAADAAEGVRFHVPAPPPAVAAALRDAHCAGARAATRSVVTGLRVTQTGATSFRVDSRFGDVGSIEVGPDGAGSTVAACTTELYVGSPPAGHFRSGIMGLAAVIVHRIYILLGITPGAGRINRFQRGVEARTTRALQRSAQV